ncbi:hypothetical protein [Streptomyces sp. NPDC018031]|uniref:hypothetical protein n=1 Tax=Streptomyces sp. NPDC018031 TaxID=3365033 RepID=UPI0037A04F30
MDVDELFDKGLGPAERMRLIERRLTLGDGSTVTVWDVQAYPTGTGGWHEDADGYEDDRGGRFYRLPEARAEYQRHRWAPEPYVPPRSRLEPSPCPAEPGARHCGNCGAATAEPGGWMVASLGLACGVDCYSVLSDGRGAHDLRFH